MGGFGIILSQHLQEVSYAGTEYDLQKNELNNVSASPYSMEKPPFNVRNPIPIKHANAPKNDLLSSLFLVMTPTKP